MAKSNGKKGFTLVEAIVSMGLIILVSFVALLAILNSTQIVRNEEIKNRAINESENIATAFATGNVYSAMSSFYGGVVTTAFTAAEGNLLSGVTATNYKNFIVYFDFYSRVVGVDVGDGGSNLPAKSFEGEYAFRVEVRVYVENGVSRLKLEAKNKQDNVLFDLSNDIYAPTARAFEVKYA